ncbi:KTSC domain-containing protein [Jiangella ureilytica]|uniref:KTSC domain-containing protein n=1 Tax=Jiangella ureilytica TaxID=2530374 RepID=A0A4R4RQ68_9ACTN|nr:KTSC domain-containing protein [Jiangella ureilytica]
MTRWPIESSAVRTMGYDAESSTLEVEFSSGDVYRYYSVAPADVEGLILADSKGTFINQVIKPRYRFRQVGGS